MTEQPATTKYLVSERFEDAVKALRAALLERGVRITGELNLSDRIHRQLMVGTPPCLVLFVSPSSEVLESVAADPGAVGRSLLHIVVSGRGLQSEVHMLRVLPANNPVLDGRLTAALSRLQGEIAQSIETIGMRISVLTG